MLVAAVAAPVHVCAFKGSHDRLQLLTHISGLTSSCWRGVGGCGSKCVCSSVCVLASMHPEHTRVSVCLCASRADSCLLSEGLVRSASLAHS